MLELNTFFIPPSLKDGKLNESFIFHQRRIKPASHYQLSSLCLTSFLCICVLPLTSFPVELTLFSERTSILVFGDNINTEQCQVKNCKKGLTKNAKLLGLTRKPRFPIFEKFFTLGQVYRAPCEEDMIPRAWGICYGEIQGVNRCREGRVATLYWRC